LLLWEKKKLARKACLPQAGRQAAKGFFLWASAPLRAKKTNNSHQSAKGLSNSFAPFLLCENKKEWTLAKPPSR